MAKKDKDSLASGKKTLEDIIRESEAEYGVGSTGKATDLRDNPYVPTGFFNLDLDLGGGLVHGKRYCFWGEDGAGKSTLCWKAITEFQKRCRYCYSRLDSCVCGNKDPMKIFYFDLERSIDKSWAGVFGADLSKVQVNQPKYLEQFIDIGAELIGNGSVDLIIVDSLAAIPVKREANASAEDSKQMASVASMLTNMKVWTSQMQSFSWSPATTVIAINQLRTDVRPVAHGKAYDPGGNYIKHNWDAKIRFKKDSKITKSINGIDTIIGMKISYDTGKNRMYTPHRVGSFDIYIQNDPSGKNSFVRGGSNNVDQIIEKAEQFEIISQVDGNCMIPGYGPVKNIKAAKKILFENPEVLSNVMERVIAFDKNISLGTAYYADGADEEIEEGEIGQDCEGDC